jgi:hypothetical protein
LKPTRNDAARSTPAQSPAGGVALPDGQRRRRASSSHLLTAQSDSFDESSVTFLHAGPVA